MAILAKRPSLFVEFLGWLEEPETLYIAMEYLERGDLTKHIGTPLPQETVKNISQQVLEGLKVMHDQGIAHRDLKPANIFVVSMSPVWVKLGDFGVSKRIEAQATTTLHTQVSTRVYGAPEVLGLDSNSETSGYTNSVDIWSLGCVICELLAGTKLFASEGQVSRYFFGKWPFPQDKLKALS
ncbi:kinase-like domain-containing protein [Tuber borchii]|uniref:non-specific serine/threonine protein kinase n=1 Tax=Tuber borchii TaxID=42251 RepID=A0A2T6ZVV7_TUBBO|nr:kinase-like domain-containing protein [Tuber borchii]